VRTRPQSNAPELHWRRQKNGSSRRRSEHATSPRRYAISPLETRPPPSPAGPQSTSSAAPLAAALPQRHPVALEPVRRLNKLCAYALAGRANLADVTAEDETTAAAAENAVSGQRAAESGFWLSRRMN